MYNCPKCGAPGTGCDVSCDCWSPLTGWKDGIDPHFDEHGRKKILPDTLRDMKTTGAIQ